ncbi:Crp/Fnr family transcriptional regulator [Sphingomonas aerophila]|uniref:CRP-like cAMP-binding protein n=1 Tax=Sphingomonas aerophila TaxID=1344948 RepID=A0A7W9BDU4_9SPHN|nr:Crp/Fnr family transcriptional regulator [Sphingomonas aerophila]MBB5715422.1 CRP-like cAMP-binding protein [Sphingomonas aerophila]
MDAQTLRHGGNKLLAILPDATLTRMALHCEHVILPKSALISEADEPITSALFIEDGIASIFKPSQPHGTEICLSGPESFCGTPLVLADTSWPYRTIVQGDHLSGVILDAASTLRLLREDEDFSRVLLRSVQVKLVQIAEGLISNANQRIPERLARWLLMYRDRLGTDQLPVTHEFMSLMIGVQRTGVTGALHDIEGYGLISAKRGLVVIRDACGLLELAAEGYGVTETEQFRLFQIYQSSSGINI